MQLIDMQLIDEFCHRAEECMHFAERAKSNRDRELFMELARAWYGIAPIAQTPALDRAKRPH